MYLCLQKTENHRVCFGKSGIHGWGLFARRNIQEGEMVLHLSVWPVGCVLLKHPLFCLAGLSVTAFVIPLLYLTSLEVLLSQDQACLSFLFNNIPFSRSLSIVVRR